MAELMDYEADYSRINALRNDLQLAVKKNKELIIESKILGRSNRDDKMYTSTRPFMSPEVTKMAKYEKGLLKIQSRFKKLREEVLKVEGM